MTRGLQGSQFTQAGLGGDQPHICGSPGWLTQVELAGIDLFQRPCTSSKTGSEPGRILPMVMAEAPRLRGAHTPAEGLELEHLHFCLILLTSTNPWQDPTSQGRGVCSTYSGRARQNRMAMGVETGRRPFLPSTCIIIIVAVWATVTEHHQLGGLSHTYLRLTVLETRKYKIKAPADLVSGKSLLPGLLVLAWQKLEETEREEASFLASCCC